MNNYATETFAYVMKLKAAATSSEFYESGMRENYLLEEPGQAYNKYRAGTEWVEMEPTEINKMPIGAMFIGVSRRDSMSRNYVIIAKDKSGNAVWFPLDTGSEQVVQIHEFDTNTGKFVPLFRGDLSNIEAKMKLRCEVGKFYLSTDINGFKLPFLADEWTYDDDELEDDLTSEEQDVLDRLKEEMGSDDDDDDDDDPDEDEHSDIEILTDSIFLCAEVQGEKTFITVGQAIKLDDEIDELNMHVEKLVAKAKHDITEARELIKHHSEVNSAFNAALPEFLERSGMGKVMNGEEPVDTDPEPIDLSIPKSSDEYDDSVLKAAPPEPEKDGIPIPSLAKYLPVDQDDEDRHMEESVPAESEQTNTDDTILEDKADTDGEVEQPKDYSDSPEEPFGADDSKWDGPSEYDDSDLQKSKQDFGDW